MNAIYFVLFFMVLFWSIHLHRRHHLLRLIFVGLTRLSYRIRVKGRNNIPKEGPAVLVVNHLSFIDWLFLFASIHRPIRFLLSRKFYSVWWFHPIARTLNGIPISSADDSTTLKSAFQSAREALDNGELLCIFPEGQLSYTGHMHSFSYRGLEAIVCGRDVPIIPIYLDGLWESIFSARMGKPLRHFPGNFFQPISVLMGAGISSMAPDYRYQLRQAMHELSCDAWFLRKADKQTLQKTFVKQARRYPWRLAVADSSQRLSYAQLLTSAICFERVLHGKWQKQSAIGILLPTGASSALMNIAVLFSGSYPVNLNGEMDVNQLAGILRQTQVKVVISSRQFIDDRGYLFPESIELIYFEDVVASIGWWQRLWGRILAFLAPISVLTKKGKRQDQVEMDSPATVVMTEADRAVILSQFNIISNIDALYHLMPWLGKKDRILVMLPFFQSTGFATLWLGLCKGIPLILHSDPLELRVVGRLAIRYAATFMLSSPKVLEKYIKGLKPKYLASVRLCVSVTEPLPYAVGEAFYRRFGIRPKESYGVTECTAIVAINTLNVRAPRKYQVGSVNGSVGRPVPGVAVRIVDPESYALKEPGKKGLLLIKGPSVMKGYLGVGDVSERFTHDGWYITGDIALIDSFDFLYIVERHIPILD